jgi:flagellin-like hook-associated protein FlgL
MISNLNPVSQQFVDNVNQIGAALTAAQEQISTGLKISQVSDAPDSISLLLQAHAAVASTTQTLTNLGLVTTEVNAGEQALSTGTTLLDQVQTLAAEGANTAQTASGNASLAQQVNSLLQQFVGLAATRINNRYVFSGNNDTQIPYTYDATQNPPISAYAGSASTRNVRDANGTDFPVALTAQQVFDSPDPATNVFTSLENLSTALATNNAAAIQTSLNGLPAVSQYLNTQLAFYGNVQDELTSSTSYAQTLQTQQQANVANLQDADVTQSIEELTQSQTQQQAALQSEALVPRTTLFNFLGNG